MTSKRSFEEFIEPSHRGQISSTGTTRLVKDRQYRPRIYSTCLFFVGRRDTHQVGEQLCGIDLRQRVLSLSGQNPKGDGRTCPRCLSPNSNKLHWCRAARFRRSSLPSPQIPSVILRISRRYSPEFSRSCNLKSGNICDPVSESLWQLIRNAVQGSIGSRSAQHGHHRLPPHSIREIATSWPPLPTRLWSRTPTSITIQRIV